MPSFDIQEQQTTIGNIQADASSFGHSGGRDIGQALSNAADTLQAYQNKKDRDWASVEMAKTRAWGAEMLSNELKNSEEGAPDLDKKVADNFRKHRDTLMKSAPRGVRDFLKTRLDMYEQDLNVSVHGEQAKASAQLTISNAEKIIDLSRNAVLNDPNQIDAAIFDIDTYIDNQDGITAKQRRDIKEHARENIAKSSIQGMDAEEALLMLNNGEYDKYLNPDDKNALINAKEREFRMDQNQARAEAETRRSVMLSDLEIKVSRGDVTYSDVEAAYQGGDGWLKPKERTRLVKELDRQLEEGQKKADQIELINAYDEGGINIDPKNPEDRAALNTHYEATVMTWAMEGADDIIERSVDYSIKYGVIPDMVKGRIRGNIRAGTPEQKVMASTMLAKLRNANQDLLNEFDNQDISKGNLIAVFSEYGAEPAEAVRLVEESLNQPQSVIDVRERDYADLEKDIYPAADWLSDKLDPSWRKFAPEIPPVMAEEFNQLALAEYKTHGNLDAARMSAFDRVLRVWGESRINGEFTMMKFAPEKFYGIPALSTEDNTEWMREQLIDDLNKSDSMIDVNENSVWLSIIPRATNNFGGPVYQINHIDEMGTSRELRKGNGDIIPWNPNWATSKEKARLDAQSARDVKKAKRRREIKLGIGPKEKPSERLEANTNALRSL